MNVLILGAGGREHTLAWKLKQSPKLNQLYVAPGNAGTSEIAINLAVGVNDFQKIKDCVISEGINMLIVGPEDPLVNGIHDFFLNDQEIAHIPVIGPEKAAATLEGSKEFAKKFMKRHAIPTAGYQSFTSDNLEEGFTFLESLPPPYVLKADGLAAGKGVLILNDLEVAKKELQAMLIDSKFGNASATVVIEEFLSGIELSCFVLTDGEHYKVLPMAKDYKRIGEGDTGLNTGGMGAVSPVPFTDEEFIEKIHSRIVQPTVTGLKKDGLPYKGFIFIGLIKVGEEPYVIEYNVRLGDPETEVVIPRIENDLLEVFKAVADVRLNEIDLMIDKRAATTVMSVSGGYPEAYEKGKVISGLEDIQDTVVFHAGTRIDDGQVVTNGGRVLAVTAYGTDFSKALSLSYKDLKKISFDGMYYRKDIGFDL
ncbi:phosphoribosylamine--glycine ligase [Muriicola sp. Z0-33]|uniref:phosphoribosylamine--glycine ligase n=1 Tax=Muriicola sp. Z0-33 TaxID=2816957 RepID=UPI0022384736|nr:phosphoribosylamine--glycine ligase [Muriicola sp. Z0-33]MCW5514637.1 phosphoribosylamine--glycine ligase [Muriicola sp. Z0-33]